jgi:hypothetical protein
VTCDMCPENFPIGYEHERSLFVSIMHPVTSACCANRLVSARRT